MPLLARCRLFGVLLLCLLNPAFAAAPAETPSTPKALAIDQVDAAALIKELEKLHSTQTHMYMVFWAPKQLWLVAASLNGVKPDSDSAQEMLSILDRYTIVFAMKTPHSGAVDDGFAGEDELRRSLGLIDSAGNRYTAFTDIEIDGHTQLLLVKFGQFINDTEDGGKNEIHPLVFPAKDKSGKPIADALATGKLTIDIEGGLIEYRLPLDSMLQPQFDPATNEIYPGSYRFNPYTGAPLQPTFIPKKTKQ